MRREEQRRPNREAASQRSGQDNTPKDTAPRLFTDEPEPRPWTHDLWAADRRRRAGEAAALEAASQSWRRDAEAALDQLAASGAVFTAEDLREVVGDCPGPSQNSFGALFAQASRAGMIETVGITTATRDVAAGHVLRQWRGTEVGR